MIKYFFDRVIPSLITAIVLILFLWLTNIISIPAASGINAAPVAQATVQSTLLPRFMNLSVGAMNPFGDAEFTNLAIPEKFRYIDLPASGYSAVITDFTLPPDYATGTPVTVRFMTNSANADCFVVFEGSSIHEGMSASANARIQFPNDDPPDFSPKWTAPEDELRIFTVSLVENSEDLPFQPGDSLSFALARLGDDLNDTCPLRVLVSGISVSYQGLSTYVPLVVR